MSKAKTSIMFISGILLCLASALVTYFSLLSMGVIEQEPIELTFNISEEQKEYDGEALNATNWNLTEGSLLKGHKAELILSGEQINVGKNIVKPIVSIYNAKGYNVTSDYAIRHNDAELTVIKRPLNISIIDAEKIYDGNALTTTDFEIVSGSLVIGHKIMLKAEKGLNDIGSVDNQVSPYIYDAAGNDVSDNYDLQFETGKLTVTKIPLTINSLNVTKEYDGTPFQNSDFTIKSGSLLEGHRIVANFLENVEVDCGTYSINISNIEVFDKDDNDVTNYYDIETISGTLTITKRTIRIITESITKEYDGISLMDTDRGQYQIDQHTPLIDGDKIEFSYFNDNIVECNTYSNDINLSSISIKDENEVNRTNNYNFEVITGKIIITKRKLIVYGLTDNFEYNGEYLDIKTCDIKNAFDLLPGHTIETFYDANLSVAKNVGTYESIIKEVSIFDEENKNVTKYYDVIKYNGNINITPRKLTFEWDDLELVYNGEKQIPQLIITGNIESDIIDYTIEGEEIDAGTYEAKVLMENDNYTIPSNMSTRYLIQPKEIEINWEKLELIYNGEKQIPQLEITGKLENDIIDYTIEGNGVNVGTYEAKVVIANDNYTIPSNMSTRYSIQPKEIEINWEKLEFDYNGQPHKPTATIDGKLPNDELEIKINEYISAGSYKEEVILTNSNYNLTNNVVEFDIKKIEIEVTPKDDTKVYDGTPLYISKADVTGLLEGHEFKILNSDSIENYSRESKEAKITEYAIYDSFENDVTENYTYKQIGSCNLKILARTVEFNCISKTKIYDGTPLMGEAVIVGGSMAPGHYIEFMFDDYIIDAQEVTDYLPTVTAYRVLYVIGDKGIKEINDYSIDGNYDFDFSRSSGTLTILPKTLTVTTPSVTKTYDGQGFAEMPEILFSGALERDREDISTLIDSYSNSNLNLSNVGNIQNEIIFSQDEYNGVLSNYDIKYEYGNLVILPKNLTITSPSATKIYDGQELLTDNCLINGAILEELEDIENLISFKNSITDVGSIENAFDLDYDRYEEILNNYNITITYGILTITPKNLLISSPSATKIYDGQELLTDNCLINGAILEELEDIENSISFKNSITDVGSIENAFDLDYDRYEEILNNYNITIAYGIFTITPKNLTITSSSATKIYDGDELGTIDSSTFFGFIESDFSDLNSGIIYNSTKDANVGSIYNIIELIGSVYDNYNITVDYGILSVTPRTINIISVSLSGTELNKEDYQQCKIIGGIESDNIEVAVIFDNDDEKLNTAGLIQNTFELDYSNYADELNNYNIIISFGILTIT